MRIGMLEGSSQRRDATERALARHGHERVLLDIDRADLQGVDAMWVAEHGDVDWTGENRLFPLISVAVARGMPVLASGSGVRALVSTGLLPGQVLPGAAGTRLLRVMSDASAWSDAVGVGTEMSVPVEAQAAGWVVDADDLAGHWHQVAVWDGPVGGTAAVATANGNVLGVLGVVDLADDEPAQAWLARPVAMLAGAPLLVEEAGA